MCGMDYVLLNFMIKRDYVYVNCWELRLVGGGDILVVLKYFSGYGGYC